MDTKRNKNNICIPSNNILTLVLAQQRNFIHCSNVSLLLINVQILESMMMMMMIIIIITIIIIKPEGEMIILKWKLKT